MAIERKLTDYCPRLLSKVISQFKPPTEEGEMDIDDLVEEADRLQKEIESLDDV